MLRRIEVREGLGERHPPDLGQRLGVGGDRTADGNFRPRFFG